MSGSKYNVAVFGHYDSRGGTMAIVLDALTKEAVARAMAQYDEDFGWTNEPDCDTMRGIIAGMPDSPEKALALQIYEQAHDTGDISAAREAKHDLWRAAAKDLLKVDAQGGMVTGAGVGRVVDQIAHRMVFGDGRPSEIDLLFVAELHDPTDIVKRALDLGGDQIDLDNIYDDNEEERTAVIIDESTVPDFPEPAADMTDEQWNEARLNLTSAVIEETLVEPVQLEVVSASGIPDEDNINSDDEENRALADKAQVLKGENVRNRAWNDDAYGFVLVR